MTTSPTYILQQIDTLPEVDQRLVFDLLAGTESHWMADTQLQRFARFPDLADNLRDSHAETSAEAHFSSVATIWEELRAWHPDGDVHDEFAVALLLDTDPAKASFGPEHMLQAALRLIERALDGRTLPDAEDDLVADAVQSLKHIAVRLAATFRFNGVHSDLEQVRPYLEQYRLGEQWVRAARRGGGVQGTHGFYAPSDLGGMIDGLAASQDERTAFDLLYRLDELDRYFDARHALEDEEDAELWLMPTQGKGIGDLHPVGTEWRAAEIIVCVPPSAHRRAEFTRYVGGRIVVHAVHGHGTRLSLKAFKKRATVNGDFIPTDADIIVKGLVR